MANQSTSVDITTAVPLNSMFFGQPIPDKTEGRAMCIILAAALEKIAGGEMPASLIVQGGATAASAASGTVTISSGSGSIGATINGVSITVTWATSDANTASLLAAAINASANALVAGIVAATSASNVVTITSVDTTKAANSITLAASGTGATASGARLTGGAGNDVTGVTFNLF